VHGRPGVPQTAGGGEPDAGGSPDDECSAHDLSYFEPRRLVSI
jgi:hypothetical protein